MSGETPEPEETAADRIRKWAEHPGGAFSWPTDGCSLEQHLRFVRHRNENWSGGSPAEFRQFVLDYAETLERSDTPKAITKAAGTDTTECVHSWVSIDGAFLCRRCDARRTSDEMEAALHMMVDVSTVNVAPPRPRPSTDRLYHISENSTHRLDVRDCLGEIEAQRTELEQLRSRNDHLERFVDRQGVWIEKLKARLEEKESGISGIASARSRLRGLFDAVLRVREDDDHHQVLSAVHDTLEIALRELRNSGTPDHRGADHEG